MIDEGDLMRSGRVAEKSARPAQPISVVVPVRNGEDMIDECLRSILASRPAEVIVVDGMSTDRTVELAERWGARVISDDGRGVAAARIMGAEAAISGLVALVDVDVVLPAGALAELVDEMLADDYVALQAAQRSISGPGYWGRALVDHHRSGRSKDWFGLVATVIRRDALLALGLDTRFASGEDIELRWRLERSGAKIGVSSRTTVFHRYGDSFAFARGQFLADGAGLARMALKFGWRATPLLGLPAAAAARGVGLSLLRAKPQWIPYYFTFWVLNWVGMMSALGRRIRGS